MFLEINLPKIWGIYRSKRVQTFHHKLSHCSVIIYIVKAGLHNETNGTNKIAEFAELT